MWTATAAVALLAGLTVVAGYEVDVRVPGEAGYGDEVVLECDYRLDAGERIQYMAWLKDGEEFLTYRDGEEPSFTLIDGIDIDLLSSTQRRVVLTNVQDSASGTYGVRMSIAANRGGNVNTYTHDQDLVVGGGAAGTLGNRFGGRPQQRPASSSSSSTTFVSSSSSSSGSSGVAAGPVGGGLGNRFGGRPAAAVPAVAAAPAPGQSAVSGLASAQNELQNAVNQLQNALNAALG